MKRIYTTDLSNHIGKEIKLSGWIHRKRQMGAIAFLVLRDGKGLSQAVIEDETALKTLEGLKEESVISIIGKVKKEERAPQGAEMQVEKIEVISEVLEDLPVTINKKEFNVNLDTLLDNRTIALRNPKQRAIFKVQGEILKAFRCFFEENNFVEINTPKIVSAGAETGGAEMFKFKYFKKGDAYLAQSPQLYKQIMIGVFERVFETAYVYRAEPSATTRHLTEYMSLDTEMGFIENWEELLEMCQEFIKYLLGWLEKKSKEDFEFLGAAIPKFAKIPVLKLTEAQEIIEKEYKIKALGAPDLDPKQEKMICEYSSKKYGSDFVFITHYPTKKRPFYTFEDPKSPKETLSFDLLFRGLEVLTGSQRHHKYEKIIENMKSKGIDPTGFGEYLDIFKHGMPPHGGFCFGLERLTMRFLELDNVKEASLFPRDMNRLKP